MSARPCQMLCRAPLLASLRHGGPPERNSFFRRAGQDRQDSQAPQGMASRMLAHQARAQVPCQVNRQPPNFLAQQRLGRDNRVKVAVPAHTLRQNACVHERRAHAHRRKAGDERTLAASGHRPGPAPVQGQKNGAGEGNRTLVRSMGSSYSAIELRPLMAEREGFEPPIPCGMHDFESCAFNQALPPLRRKQLLV